MKIQFRGHCPHCGKIQAVTSGGKGRIANHGYNVSYGFFSGICSGAGKKAIEQDPSDAAAYVLWAAAESEKASALLAEYKANPNKPMPDMLPARIKRHGQYVTGLVDIAELSEKQKERGMELYLSVLKAKASGLKSLAVAVGKLIKTRESRPLYQVNIEEKAVCIIGEKRQGDSFVWRLIRKERGSYTIRNENGRLMMKIAPASWKKMPLV